MAVLRQKGCYYSNKAVSYCYRALFRTAEMSRDCFFFNKPGFCSNLGKESKKAGAPWTCLCKPERFTHLLMISQKVPDRQQPHGASVVCMCVCGWGGISQTEMICLKRTNCRLWLGQAWGIMDALKIARALVKLREPAQVASSRLHRPELSGGESRRTTPVKMNTQWEAYWIIPHITVFKNVWHIIKILK